MFLSWMLTLAGMAWAGCETDLDCKGDRICEAEACTDPGADAQLAPVAPVAPIPSLADTAATPQATVDLRGAEQRYRLARSRATTSLVLGGLCVGLGVPASAMGLADAYWVAPTAIGGTALVLGAVGGGLAVGGATQARAGAELAGLQPAGKGGLSAGIAAYGLGMAMGAGAVAGGVAQAGPDAGALGMGAVLLTGTSIAILGADNGAHRRRLREAGVAGRPGTSPHLVLLPTPRGVLLVGRF